MNTLWNKVLSRSEAERGGGENNSELLSSYKFMIWQKKSDAFVEIPKAQP